MKRILLVLAAAVLLFSLTACGNSDPSGDSGKTSSVSSGSGIITASDIRGEWVMENGSGFKFNEDGTGSYFWLDKNDPGKYSSENEFTFELNDGQIYLYYQNLEADAAFTYGISVDGDILTINEHGSERFYTRR